MVLEIFIFSYLDYIASIPTFKQSIKTNTNVLLSSIKVLEIALFITPLSGVYQVSSTMNMNGFSMYYWSNCT